MNVSLAAQLESPLLTSLQSSIVSKPFNYSLKKNYPLLSKSNVTISPTVTPSGVAYGSSMVFKLPRYGLITGISFKVDCSTSATKTATLTRTSRVGSRFFSNISLRSHNRVIQDNDQHYIDNRINNSSSEQENAFTNMTTPVPAINNNLTSTVFYTPSFMYFGERSENALDLAFAEPLELVATVNSRAGIWGTSELLLDMTFVSVTATCYFINLENSTQAALTASQHPLSNNLTMLANDSYQEVPEEVTLVGGGAATATITLQAKSNHVVGATHFACRAKAANTLLPIESVTMTSSGQTLVDSTRRSQIYENAIGQNRFIHNVPGSTSGENMYSIYYGLDSDKTYISGAQSLSSLNSPTYVVTVDTSSLSGGEVLELFAQHDYFTLLSVDSGDGSIQRSLAN